MAATNIALSPTSTATNAATTLRDIKPPVEIPSEWGWVWWIAGAIAAAALVGILIFLWDRYRKERKRQWEAAPGIPAHIRARQRLDEALALLSQPKPFCIAVSDALRCYLEERFDFHAPERTTEEFLHELQGTSRLSPQQKEGLAEFLKQCDLVKFARYEPREPELRVLHDSALRLVEETEPKPVEPGESSKPRTRKREHASA